MAGTPSKKRKRPGPRKQPPRGNPQKVHVSRDPRARRKGDRPRLDRRRATAHAAARDHADPDRHGCRDPRGRSVPLGDRAVLPRSSSVSLQIGVNFANDYSDGIRGTDDHRVGPARLTASRKAPPRAVLIAALVFFAIAAVAGLAIVIRSQQWWLLLVGAACIVAAWFYTGGKRPYGYYGLGELFVFVFFGLVATVGTTFVQVLAVPQEAWFGAVARGSARLRGAAGEQPARHRPGPRRAQAHAHGADRPARGRACCSPCSSSCRSGSRRYLALFYPIAWLALLALLAALPAILIVWTYRVPRELVVALSLTSLTSVAYGAFLMWAFIG